MKRGAPKARAGGWWQGRKKQAKAEQSGPFWGCPPFQVAALPKECLPFQIGGPDLRPRLRLEKRTFKMASWRDGERRAMATLRRAIRCGTPRHLDQPVEPTSAYARLGRAGPISGASLANWMADPDCQDKGTPGSRRAISAFSSQFKSAASTASVRCPPIQNRVRTVAGFAIARRATSS